MWTSPAEGEGGSLDVLPRYSSVETQMTTRKTKERSV
jgi:hypothetical protein